MKWIEMDVRDLKFDNESFDVIIDKGTMDCLLNDYGYTIDPSSDLAKDVRSEIDEIQRVLKIGGVFLYITVSDKEFKEPHLKRSCWRIKTSIINDYLDYFFYSMVKEN